MVPMQATDVGDDLAFDDFRRACKLMYEGERKWQRRGFGEPSLAIKQPKLSARRFDGDVRFAGRGRKNLL